MHFDLYSHLGVLAHADAHETSLATRRPSPREGRPPYRFDATQGSGTCEMHKTKPIRAPS